MTGLLLLLQLLLRCDAMRAVSAAAGAATPPVLLHLLHDLLFFLFLFLFLFVVRAIRSGVHGLLLTSSGGGGGGVEMLHPHPSARRHPSIERSIARAQQTIERVLLIRRQRGRRAR